MNPGAVECILELPRELQLLIGYERGLIVLWDIKEQKNIRVRLHGIRFTMEKAPILLNFHIILLIT